MRRNVAGALSLVALVAGERKPPYVAGMHLTTSRGLILNLNNSRIAAKRCHYNTGGYMTLAELGMAFWHD
ncbi:toxic polypeptide, small, partial [Escherichia coli]